MCLRFRNAIHLKFPTQFQLEAAEWFRGDKAVIHNIFYQEWRQNWHLSLLLLPYDKSLIFSSPETKVYLFPYPKPALSLPPWLFQNLPMTTSTDEESTVRNHSWLLNYLNSPSPENIDGEGSWIRPLSGLIWRPPSSSFYTHPCTCKSEEIKKSKVEPRQLI